MFHQIDKCRLCGNERFRPILDLGVQALTGVFPHTRDERVGGGPLELVKCGRGGAAASRCGLVLPWQFRDSICEKERKLLDGGGRLLIPLPSVEIVSS